MLKNKSDTLKAFEKFIADISPYGNLKYVRTDQGTEFTSGTFESVLIKNKMNHQKPSPYSPHQNGTIERRGAQFLKWLDGFQKRLIFPNICGHTLLCLQHIFVTGVTIIELGPHHMKSLLVQNQTN